MGLVFLEKLAFLEMRCWRREESHFETLDVQLRKIKYSELICNRNTDLAVMVETLHPVAVQAFAAAAPGQRDNWEQVSGVGKTVNDKYLAEAGEFS